MDATPRFRFSLGNLLLAMVPLALMIALVKYAWQNNGPLGWLAIVVFIGPAVTAETFRDGFRGLCRGTMLGACFAVAFCLFFLLLAGFCLILLEIREAFF